MGAFPSIYKTGLIFNSVKCFNSLIIDTGSTVQYLDQYVGQPLNVPEPNVENM